MCLFFGGVICGYFLVFKWVWCFFEVLQEIWRKLLLLMIFFFLMQRICKPNVSVGHSYNLIDIKSRRILNIETASSNRFSIHEVGKEPLFHANMYLHLKIDQVNTWNVSHSIVSFLPKIGIVKSYFTLIGTRWKFYKSTEPSSNAPSWLKRKGAFIARWCWKWKVPNFHDRYFSRVH